MSVYSPSVQYKSGILLGDHISDVEESEIITATWAATMDNKGAERVHWILSITAT